MAPLLPDELLLNLSQIHEDDLEEFALQNYRKYLIDANGRGDHKCHDGEAVIIWETRAAHALYTPKNHKETFEKQKIDKRRVERLPWLLPLIAGEMPNSECWSITEHGRTKRLYVVRGKNYVVWLEPKDVGVWTFSTAYVANASNIYGQTRKQKRIWTK